MLIILNIILKFKTLFTAQNCIYMILQM